MLNYQHMLIIDADDFHMKLKKNANSVDFKLWGSGASAGEVQQTKLIVSSQSKGNELDCL